MSDYISNEVIGHHQNFDKEYKIIRQSDGKECWVHGLGQLEYNELNEPIKLLGTITNIDDRKQAEEALQEKMNELLRFQNVTIGRELVMIELKKEINQLLIKSGQQAKYKIVE
jgi:PAS domain-containing protein